MTTLNYERAISGGHNHASQLQSLVELARQVTVNGHPANEDEYFRQQIAQLKIELESLKFTGYRALTRQIKGLPAGPELSMLKTVGCSLVLNMMRVSTEMLGGFGTLAELCPNPSVPDGRDWLHRLLGVRGVTIAGGTTEISRNIIGERTLGLPKS
jgi:alkylation response protein AidB-like acyl-CoA dehydrogenase